MPAMFSDPIDAILNRLVSGNKTPSVQYVVFNRDEILHRYSGGYADLGQQRITDDHTSYHLYSVTKTFTALAVLQLAEQQKLDIELPAANYLPSFAYGPTITVRHLLNHTAGIPNPIPLRWIHAESEHATFDRNAFFEKVEADHPKTRFGPNTRFAYSNLGYVLLGQIIESVSGIAYENYIRNNILQPLQLSREAIDFTVAEKGSHATGYHKKFSLSYLLLGLLMDKSRFMANASMGWALFRNNYVNGAPYGGLIGTADALVCYIRELLKPGCSLITDSYKHLLFTENHTADGRATGMCLSWFKGELQGNTYFTHAGGGGGFYCEIRIYPERNMGSVILFNRTGMTDERFLNQLDRYVLEPK